jgi:hypothetical protein
MGFTRHPAFLPCWRAASMHALAGIVYHVEEAAFMVGRVSGLGLMVEPQARMMEDRSDPPERSRS